MDYFYFNIGEDDLEISLSQISGSPADLVLSFDATNKFPTKEQFDYHS